MSTNWFYVENGQKVGPVEEDLIVNLIKDHQLVEDSYVWKKGFENWTKVKDIEELKIHLEFDEDEEGQETLEPFVEMKIMKKPEKREGPESSGEETQFDWNNISRDEKCVYIMQVEDESVYGPYTLNFIPKLYNEGRIDSHALVFIPGMVRWSALENIPIIGELIPEIFGYSTNANDDEKYKRPVIVKFVSHSLGKDQMGICRDLTVGGTQILTTGLSGRKGDFLEINLYPNNGSKSYLIKCKIERILHSDQGAFVRFSHIDENAKEDILSYFGD